MATTIEEAQKIRNHQTWCRFDDCLIVQEGLIKKGIPIDANEIPLELKVEGARSQDGIIWWLEDMIEAEVLPLGKCVLGEKSYTDAEIEAETSLRTQAYMAEKDWMYEITMYIAQEGLKTDILVHKSRMRFLKYAWRYMVEYGKDT